MNTIRIINYQLIFLLAIVISSCGSKKQPEAEVIADSAVSNTVMLTKDKQKMMNLQVKAAERKPVSINFSANGKVVVLSQNREILTARINGSVQKILVLEGQKISKGQVLMEISSGEFIQLQENYLSAKAEIGFLKSDYERQRKLKEADISAGKELQQAESKYLSCVTRLRSAEARLKYLGVDVQSLSVTDQTPLSPTFSVRSTINGYLLALPVSLGMSVNPDMELAHIVNLDHYHADIFVYEKDVNKVKEGQEVAITFTNQTLPTVKGEVEFISRGMDPATRTIIIHVVFETLYQGVLPDMTLKAIFKTTLPDQLTLPGSAFITEDNSHFVYYCLPTAPEKFIKAQVKLLSQNEENNAFELVSSVPADALFVVKGLLLVESEAHKAEMTED